MWLDTTGAEHTSAHRLKKQHQSQIKISSGSSNSPHSFCHLATKSAASCGNYWKYL